MVEAVKNLPQIQSTSAHNVPTGTGQVVHAESRLENPLFGYGSDLTSDQISSPYLNMDNMDMSVYGPMALNKRVFDAYKQQMRQTGYDFENQSITAEDQNNLEPLSETLDEYRILGMRLHHNSEVTENLEEAKKSGIGVALYLTNCAKEGLKNPNQPVSFANLKNPIRLVDTLTHLSLTAPEANENINLLSDIAIKERSPEMAACLLESTAKGGLLGIGVDSKTADKLLIESKDKFENKEDYYKFVTSVDRAYKQLFPGKSLNEYINANYKPTWQKATPIGGIATGIALAFASGGGLPGAAIGAIIGGIAGLAIYSSTWFGKNSDGDKLVLAINKARQTSHDVDVQKYSFGGLSNSVGSTIPSLN